MEEEHRFARATQATARSHEWPNRRVAEHSILIWRRSVNGRVEENTAEGHATASGRWVYAVRERKSRKHLHSCSCVLWEVPGLYSLEVKDQVAHHPGTLGAS